MSEDRSENDVSVLCVDQVSYDKGNTILSGMVMKMGDLERKAALKKQIGRAMSRRLYFGKALAVCTTEGDMPLEDHFDQVRRWEEEYGRIMGEPTTIQLEGKVRYAPGMVHRLSA